MDFQWISKWIFIKNRYSFLDFHFVCLRDREGHIEEESEGAHRKAESKREKERERSGVIHPACVPVCMMWLFAVTQ